MIVWGSNQYIIIDREGVWQSLGIGTVLFKNSKRLVKVLRRGQRF